MEIPDKTYFSILEVSKITGVKPYVLRYWESEFKLLRPARRQSGQRRYIKKDLETIVYIKKLLYEQKYSIAGAKKKMLEEARNKNKQVEMDLEKNSAAINMLKETKETLKEILKIMDQNQTK